MDSPHAAYTHFLSCCCCCCSHGTLLDVTLTAQLDQVLRNLISNALKFSDKNMTVIVSCGFQPTTATTNSSTSLKKLLSTRANVRTAGVSSGRLDSVRYGGLRLLLRGRPTTRVQVPQEVSAAPDGAIGRHQRGYLVVTVTDTGAGINKENQKLLFGEGVQFNPEKVPSPPYHTLNRASSLTVRSDPLLP